MQGQLGHGAQGNMNLPTAVKSLGGVCAKQLACGEAHTLLCTAQGDVYSWGWGEKGQLGHNDLNNLNTPHIVKDLQGLKIGFVACGLAHSAVVTSDCSETYAWGWDQYGQLGLGSLSWGNVKNKPNRVKASLYSCPRSTVRLPSVYLLSVPLAALALTILFLRLLARSGCSLSHVGARTLLG